MPTLEIGRLTEQDKRTLPTALFEDQVIVIRGQRGIEPTVLPELAKVFNESAIGAHSAGEKAVSDPRNILSAYKAGRIPQAPQVGIIGLGKFQDYEGIPELEVIHLEHSLFHESPLSQEGLQEGATRPYRWNMDTPSYERLPGEVTVLHLVQIPKIPDQKIRFPITQKRISVRAQQHSFLMLVHLNFSPPRNRNSNSCMRSFSFCTVAPTKSWKGIASKFSSDAGEKLDLVLMLKSAFETDCLSRTCNAQSLTAGARQLFVAFDLAFCTLFKRSRLHA